MTCEDFRTTFKTVCPHNTTSAVRAAMVRHTLDCAACMTFVETDETPDPRSPEEKIIGDVLADIQCLIDRTDAEYCEVVDGGLK